jgi:exopolysaccharide production protein ExoZ
MLLYGRRGEDLRKQIHSIQALRAIAAASVVIHHVLSMLVHNAGYSFSAWSTGSVGIDLFFCISGFVMVYAHATDFQELGAGSSFIRRRAIRIVPLYWLATTATLGLLVAMPGMFSSITLNWSNVFCSYLFVMSRNSLGDIGTLRRWAGHSVSRPISTPSLLSYSTFRGVIFSPPPAQSF